jgi:hypothetical protein
MTINGGNMPGSWYPFFLLAFSAKNTIQEDHMKWEQIALEMEYLTNEERTLLHQIRLTTSERIP